VKWKKTIHQKIIGVSIAKKAREVFYGQQHRRSLPLFFNIIKRERW
jgi:hypothetical protein